MELYVRIRPISFTGNPNLLPERIDRRPCWLQQPLFNDRFRFGATYFHNNITNLIDATFTTYINVGHAET